MSEAGAYQKDLLASSQSCAGPSRHYRQFQPTPTHSSFYFEEVLVQATLITLPLLNIYWLNYMFRNVCSTKMVFG